MDAKWFAGRLRELREEAGLTQQQLADAAGLKIGGIRDLEQGRSGPTWETVIALCQALGKTCEAFTVEPQPAPVPERGRPRKAAPEDMPTESKGRKRTEKK